MDLILLFKKIQKNIFIYYLNLVFFMFTITCVNLSLGVYFEISFYEAASKIWVGSIQSHISTSNMSDDVTYFEFVLEMIKNWPNPINFYHPLSLIPIL